MLVSKLKTRLAYLSVPALVLVVGSPLQAKNQDDRIVAAAKDSYNFRTYLKDDRIQVTSSHGVVTLKGTVARDYHKFLAEETVSGLPGVKKVDNQLTLVGEQPTEHSDTWISTKVKAALIFHKNVSGTSTEVSTDKGVVTLSGKADSETQKDLATAYAKDVLGVTSVRNNMTVSTPTEKRTFGDKVDDASITAQLKTTLLFHKSTHVLATKVVTKNGVVTLRGEVNSGAEKDLVTKLAEDIHGVKQVKNRMTVKKS